MKKKRLVLASDVDSKQYLFTEFCLAGRTAISHFAVMTHGVRPKFEQLCLRTLAQSALLAFRKNLCQLQKLAARRHQARLNQGWINIRHGLGRNSRSDRRVCDTGGNDLYNWKNFVAQPQGNQGRACAKAFKQGYDRVIRFLPLQSLCLFVHWRAVGPELFNPFSRASGPG
jgi:hypothetical protein